MDEQIIDVIASIFILALGIVFAGIGIKMIVRQHRKNRLCTELTQGTVTGTADRWHESSKRSRGGGLNVYPVFTINVNGAEYKLVYPRGFSPLYIKLAQVLFKRYREGDIINGVYYNPDNPVQFYIKRYRYSHVLHVIVSFTAGVFLMAFAWFFYFVLTKH